LDSALTPEKQQARDKVRRLLALASRPGTPAEGAAALAAATTVAADNTDGYGADAVLECVGLDQSMETAIEIARPGGAVGRVGVPQHESLPGAKTSFFNNVTIGGGPAPVRAYIDELLPDILDGRIDPGRVFDRTVDLDGVPDGYRAMNDRESIKVLVNP